MGLDDIREDSESSEVEDEGGKKDRNLDEDLAITEEDSKMRKSVIVFVDFLDESGFDDSINKVVNVLYDQSNKVAKLQCGGTEIFKKIIEAKTNELTNIKEISEDIDVTEMDYISRFVEFLNNKGMIPKVKNHPKLYDLFIGFAKKTEAKDRALREKEEAEKAQTEAEKAQTEAEKAINIKEEELKKENQLRETITNEIHTQEIKQDKIDEKLKEQAELQKQLGEALQAAKDVRNSPENKEHFKDFELKKAAKITVLKSNPELAKYPSSIVDTYADILTTNEIIQEKGLSGKEVRAFHEKVSAIDDMMGLLPGSLSHITENTKYLSSKSNCNFIRNYYSNTENQAKGEEDMKGDKWDKLLEEMEVGKGDVLEIVNFLAKKGEMEGLFKSIQAMLSLSNQSMINIDVNDPKSLEMKNGELNLKTSINGEPAVLKFDKDGDIYLTRVFGYSEGSRGSMTQSLEKINITGKAMKLGNFQDIMKEFSSDRIYDTLNDCKEQKDPLLAFSQKLESQITQEIDKEINNNIDELMVSSIDIGVTNFNAEMFLMGMYQPPSDFLNYGGKEGGKALTIDSQPNAFEFASLCRNTVDHYTKHELLQLQDSLSYLKNMSENDAKENSNSDMLVKFKGIGEYGSSDIMFSEFVRAMSSDDNSTLDINRITAFTNDVRRDSQYAGTSMIDDPFEKAYN